MTSIALVAMWAIAANVTAMLSTRDQHWTSAYVLIAIGIPLLGYVTWQNGPWIGLIALLAGMSVLRWPVIYFGRWLRRMLP